MSSDISKSDDGFDGSDAVHETPAVAEGAVFVVAHPFQRGEFEKFLGMDGEGNADLQIVESWTPGVRFEPDYDGGTIEEFDGIGAQILTVVAVFKPGKFPSRVFYTRKWRDPRGHEFGKGALRIKTIGTFRQIIAGYRYLNPTRLKTSAEWFAAELAKATRAPTTRGEAHSKSSIATQAPEEGE